MSRSFHGVAAAPGVAVGSVARLDAGATEIRRHRPAGSSAGGERDRLDEARGIAREEILSLRTRLSETLGERQAAILDAQALVLDDPALLDEVDRRLADGDASAEEALRGALSGFVAKIEAIDDPYLRERASDLADLERRLTRLLAGTAATEASTERGPAIVVAHAIGPSDTVALARDGVVGLAADLGGPTSHTAILARALGLPSVIGLGKLAAQTTAGERIVVDGDRGLVLLDASDAEVAEAMDRRASWLAIEEHGAESRDLPAVTKDGILVTLRANVEFPEEVVAADRFGAQGIGLYRSEFLYIARAPRLPDEEDHRRTALDLAARLAPYPVVVRTLDLGGEKYFHEVLERAESNPVLGLRGLRLCLARPAIFVPQLRGLLRAAAEADVRILLPLVTSLAELRAVRELIAREAASLRSAGIACRPDVPLGVMIETPAAAMTADLLAREADFLSVGTNDLVQYALAVDRGNPSVASLYDPFHPAVLRMLRFVLRAGRARGVPVSLCGEIAGAPELVPALVGLGFRELSCPPRAIPRVRDAIRATMAADAARLIEARMEDAPEGKDA